MRAVENRATVLAVAAASALSLIATSANAAALNSPATFSLGGPASWTAAGSWSISPDYPSGDLAAVTFNAPTATRGVTLDAAITVPSITFNSGNFTTTLSAGTGGSLTFDTPTAGPATITTTGSGTSGQTISAGMTLTDSLTVDLQQTPGNGTSGSLTLSGAMSGPGGLTKTGPGLLTISTNNKTYLGPTNLNAGRIRISTAGAITNSVVTVAPGAQITMIATTTNTAIGSTLNLNGNGLGAGDFPGDFPGAIRNDTNLVATITSPTVLQSDTLIHVQGAATGSTTFSNSISGVGRLTFTALNSNTDLGQLVLNGNNSYAGGTTVNGGNLVVSGAAADLGSGNVEVKNVIAGGNARLTISTGVANAIDDLATLILEGGGGAGVADQAYAILGAGVNDTIAGLVLGGVTQTQEGTYGSSTSGATFQLDEYFSGTGVVTLAIPEPTGLALLGFGAAGLLARRRGSR